MPQGETRHADLDDLPVCLVRVDDGSFFAVHDVCSHEETPLSDGWVYDCKIECSLHGAVFDLQTGDAVSLPATEPIPTYPVRRDGDDLVVTVAD